MPPRAKRKKNYPEQSDVDFEIQRLEGLSVAESSPPRREPQGEPETERRILPTRAPGAQLGIVLHFHNNLK